MNNTIETPNPLRARLRTFVVVFLLFTLLYAFTLIIIHSVDTSNYNGEVKQVTGTVSNFERDKDDGLSLTLSDGTIYNCNPLKSVDENIDCSNLIGKEVMLYVPQSQFGNGAPFVLGIMCGETTVVDYHETLTVKREESKIGFIVLGILTGIFGLGTCATFIWMVNIPQTKQYNLAEKYSDYFKLRQPSSPTARKALLIFTLGGLIAILVLAVVCIVIGTVYNDVYVNVAVAITTCVAIIAYSIGAVFFTKWHAKKEQEFYSQNYPFDFTDISHIAMRKSIKAQLQASIREERDKYPNRYGDGASIYTLEFTADGVEFYDFDYENEQATPSTEEIFGVSDEAPQYVGKLTYDELNFEALPFYRKRSRPLTIVIKSRIDPEKTSLPVDLIHDVHLTLDSNLLATLKRFDVKVDNLDYLLANKTKLMQENCKKSKTN